MIDDCEDFDRWSDNLRGSDGFQMNAQLQFPIGKRLLLIKG